VEEGSEVELVEAERWKTVGFQDGLIGQNDNSNKGL